MESSETETRRDARYRARANVTEFLRSLSNEESDALDSAARASNLRKQERIAERERHRLATIIKGDPGEHEIGDDEIDRLTHESFCSASITPTPRHFPLRKQSILRLRREHERTKTVPNPHGWGCYHFIIESLKTLGVDRYHSFQALRISVEELMGAERWSIFAYRRSARHRPRPVSDVEKDVSARLHCNCRVMQRTKSYGLKLLQVGQLVIGTEGCVIDIIRKADHFLYRLNTDAENATYRSDDAGLHPKRGRAHNPEMQSVLVAKRKARVWAPKPDAVDRLGRSARQLARTSTDLLRRPDVAERLRRVMQLAALENASKLARADLLVRLVDEDGLRAIDISRATGLRQADLCQMLATARMFPPEARPAGVPYNILLLATRMLRKFPGLGMSSADALAEIQRTGFSQHRDVTRLFSQIARAAEMRRASPAPMTLGDGIINTCHHARFQELLHRVPNGAAKIIAVDPPYVYRRTACGRYTSTSARSRHCDNDGAAAISLVIDLLRDWQPKLASGGVLLLWQASGPLHREILDAVDRYDWELTGPIIWDKVRPQPGDFGAPYSRQTEMLWVLSRPGEKLVNHDGSSRSDILCFAPVSYPTISHQQDHCFEKPVALCEFLVNKHSRAGELVLDLCGCSGSMSIAAINQGRKWMYVESHRDNYQLGAGRIARRLAGCQAKAS